MIYGHYCWRLARAEYHEQIVSLFLYTGEKADISTTLLLGQAQITILHLGGRRWTMVSLLEPWSVGTGVILLLCQGKASWDK